MVATTLTKEKVKKGTIFSLGSQDTQKITMDIDQAAIAHIIDKLTDLYPKPVDATVRELVSNAVDATLVSAKDKKVNVSPPSALNQYLVVEDFGTGMSPDDVKNIYSRYGASTKRNDLSVIGAYGLGAKAPLSYTDKFTVETTKNKITTSFAVTRGDTGNVVEIYNTTKANKPSGTVVTVPVKDKDIYLFRDAINTYNNSPVSIIDTGDVKNGNPKEFIKVGTVLFDEATQTEGTIWYSRQPKKILSEYIDVLTDRQQTRDIKFNYDFMGWRYQNPENSYYYGNPDFTVELKPGLVDFTSSRDEIIQNKRSEHLNTLIRTHIQDNYSKFITVAYKTLIGKEIVPCLAGESWRITNIASHQGPIEKTKDGFNLKAFLKKNYSSLMIPAFVMSFHPGQRGRDLILTYQENKPVVKVESYNSLRSFSASTHAYDVEDISLNKVLSYTDIKHKNLVTVVTDAETLKEKKRVYTNRKTLVGSPDFILFIDETKVDRKELKAAIQKYTECEVKFTTLEDLIPKKVYSTSGTTRTRQKPTGEVRGSWVSFDNMYKQRYGSDFYISTETIDEEFIEENIIFFCDKNTKSVSNTKKIFRKLIERDKENINKLVFVITKALTKKEYKFLIDNNATIAIDPYYNPVEKFDFLEDFVIDISNSDNTPLTVEVEKVFQNDVFQAVHILVSNEFYNIEYVTRYAETLKKLGYTSLANTLLKIKSAPTASRVYNIGISSLDKIKNFFDVTPEIEKAIEFIRLTNRGNKEDLLTVIAYEILNSSTFSFDDMSKEEKEIAYTSVAHLLKQLDKPVV